MGSDGRPLQHRLDIAIDMVVSLMDGRTATERAKGLAGPTAEQLDASLRTITAQVPLPSRRPDSDALSSSSRR